MNSFCNLVPEPYMTRDEWVSVIQYYYNIFQLLAPETVLILITSTIKYYLNDELHHYSSSFSSAAIVGSLSFSLT